MTEDVRVEFNWRRNLAILWFAQFIAMVGLGAGMPVFPLFVRELGVMDPEQSQLWTGFIFSAPFVTSLFATPIWGALGDRYGRKAMTVRAIIGLVLSYVLIGCVQSVWLLLLVRFLQGAISGFIASTLALVSSTTPEKNNGYAIGILQSSLPAGMVIGPALGGWIADMIGVRQVFFTIAVLCVISGLVVWAFVRDSGAHLDPNRKAPSLRENIRFVASDPALRRILLCITLVQSGVVFVGPVFTFFVESLGAPPDRVATLTGVLIGSAGLAMAIATPLWGRQSDKMGSRHVIRLVSLPAAIFALLPAFAWDYMQLFPLRVAMGIFASGLMPTLYGGLSKRSPEKARGAIMGLGSSANLLANLLSPMLCGIISSSLGMRWAVGAPALMFLAVYFVSGREERTLLTVPHPIKK